jgi:hypothetical protein
VKRKRQRKPQPQKYTRQQYTDIVAVSDAHPWAEIVIEVDGGWMAFPTVEECIRWQERQYAKWARGEAVTE